MQLETPTEIASQTPTEITSQQEDQVSPTDIASVPENVGSDEAEQLLEYALQKFEALKILNNDYANATFEEARQMFEQIKTENGDIPASVSFEYALLNDLLLPARKKRDLKEKAKRVFAFAYTNCTQLSSWMRKIYPFCSDRTKRSTTMRFSNLTDVFRRFTPKCQAHVLTPPTPNDYRISPAPLIFMAVASSLGLLSSLILICKAFCCQH